MVEGMDCEEDKQEIGSGRLTKREGEGAGGA